MKKYLLPLTAALCIALSGCRDAKLAEAAEGTWQTTLELKDEYGTPYDQMQTYTFKHEPDALKDGGTFVEYTLTTMTEEVEDIEVTYTTETSIEGEWEVIFGDLYQTYWLQTLDVAVTDVDYRLSDKASLDTQLDYLGAAVVYGMLGQEPIDKDELAEEIRKNAYQGFYASYEECNGMDGEGSCYDELTIKNGIMEFNTSDVGRIRLKKVR